MEEGKPPGPARRRFESGQRCDRVLGWWRRGARCSPSRHVQGDWSMTEEVKLGNRSNIAVLKGLTYLMFAMFAMTTDSVGIIIPEIIKAFHLSLTAAGSFQYATMAGIALAGFLLGHLADRCGRNYRIVDGLT